MAVVVAYIVVMVMPMMMVAIVIMIPIWRMPRPIERIIPTVIVRWIPPAVT